MIKLILEWWDSYAWLAPRTPVAIISNFYFHYDVFPPNQDKQAARAAQLAYSALKFKIKLDR